jgi:hypothetical protein
LCHARPLRPCRRCVRNRGSRPSPTLARR